MGKLKKKVDKMYYERKNYVGEELEKWKGMKCRVRGKIDK